MEKLLEQLQSHFPELKGGAGNRLFLVTLFLTIIAAWGAQTGLFKFQGPTQYLSDVSNFEVLTDVSVARQSVVLTDTLGRQVSLSRNESAALQPAAVFASSFLPSIGPNLNLLDPVYKVSERLSQGYSQVSNEVYERVVNVFRADAFEVLGNFAYYYNDPSKISLDILRNFEEVVGGLQVNMILDKATCTI
jgi:hypothetical protein